MLRAITKELLLISALLLPALAHADAPVKAEVLVVLAKTEAGSIDEKLKSLPALQKPPFNGFGSLKLLATHEVALSSAEPATIELPNGRRLKLKLLERLPDGRHKLEVSINRPDQKDYLPLLTVVASGEPFFVAGQKHAGGTLVIGVRVPPAK
jgi:hypothetical protein